jgi:formylmethanofuran dehydrogenase subunit B
VRIVVAPPEEVAALTLATARVGGQSRAALSTPASEQPESGSGAHASSDLEARTRQLADLVLAGRYVAIVADGEPDAAGSSDFGRAGALIALAQAANSSTRCALTTLRAGGNRSGAEVVATSSTGYPMAIDFSRGHPRYRPFDGAAGVGLERGAFDAVLVVGSARLVTPDIAGRIAALPHAILGPRASDAAADTSHVVIDTGIAGIHEGGTAIRMDDVPLPLRGALSGPRSTLETVLALLTRCGRRG